ncbi:hypothetical protein BLNAU_11143 [Blattamonas nauphoetae]|uniref:Mediator complex subunit 5 n=1 Tax=Blattamonas nauphoetae TaxID=2049346 RepID=A0ABQ9XR60_9EUKA|nr:hypothetical protein BLNAU_11143 [Blattamonas nauphoetae]
MIDGITHFFILDGIKNPSIFDDLTRMTHLAYSVVMCLEDTYCVDPAVRLTAARTENQSTNFSQFKQLVDPEIVEVRKQFNSQLFEEVGRISMWRWLLQKVADGEEVQKDTSFLKSPIFRPTLLSLQAKFQQLASSVDGSEDSSTSSLYSSHSSPQTSLEALLDSSLRTHSSLPNFRQESLRLLTILHSLLTSPLPPSPTKQFRSENHDPRLAQLQPDPINPSELFDSSLFDEADNEKLARSLVRCKSVCEIVGAEKCIRDIPNFIYRTVSALGTADSLLRAAAFSQVEYFDTTSSFVPMLPRLWNRLHSAFRDGTHEEQGALLLVSTKWMIDQFDKTSLPPFPATEFDWDGLINADLSDLHAFGYSIILILWLRNRSIKNEIGRPETTRILLAFEQHQQAVSRIVSTFDGIQQLEDDPQYCQCLVSYCLLISLLSNRDFHPTLTSFLTEHPELDHHNLLPFENKIVFLCHTSLNRHKPHQPPLDFLFERTLRMSPLDFFLHHSEPDADISSSLLNTSLCGYHALFRRGMHLALFETEHVGCGDHLIISFWMFSSPLISDTFDLFLYFPPPLVVRFFLPILSSATSLSFLVEPLRAMMTTLFIVTAPFGDCHSLKELFRSVRHRNNVDHEQAVDRGITIRCENLEWLNLPTGFESALAHSNTPVAFNHFQTQLSQRISTDHSLEAAHLTTAILGFLPEGVNISRDTIITFGEAQRLVFEYDILTALGKMMLSPIPAEVSVFLELVKRLACVGSVGIVMEMVHYGILDVVTKLGVAFRCSRRRSRDCCRSVPSLFTNTNPNCTRRKDEVPVLSLQRKQRKRTGQRADRHNTGTADLAACRIVSAVAAILAGRG